MSESRGKFMWYDLMTTDVEAAKTFYHAVFGWTARPSEGLPERGYQVVSTAGTGIGGMMALPAQTVTGGARPGWLGYIQVDDVDACVARLQQAGGGLHRAAEDIPTVGRFAVVADPQGASFVLFEDTSGRPAAPAPAMGAPGYFGWHELQTSDLEPAFAFYASMFGWKKGDAVDMGAEMGPYQMFSTPASGEAAGGMMKKWPQVPAPYWLYYVNVDDIDAAVARVKANAGQLLNGPHPVPGDLWIAQCMDPQGAVFAMSGAKR